MINWIRKIREFDALNGERLFLKEMLKRTNLQLSKSLDEVETLRGKLNKQRASVTDAEFWNTKWKQSTIYYSAPKRKKVINYVTENTGLTGTLRTLRDRCDLLISSNGLHPGSVDSVPLSVMRWIAAEKFKYKHDKGELWKTPEQVWADKDVGNDCDDIMILEYYMIRYMFTKLGVWGDVRHRLKCVAGNVNRKGSIPSSAGGHAYLNWLCDDGNWYTIETTYNLPTAILNYNKKSQKFNSMYGTIWFSFNEQYSWAQNSLTVCKDDFDKRNK